MNAEEVLKVLDEAVPGPCGCGHPACSVDRLRALLPKARAAIEQMAKDAERYQLLCQHVDASIAYARRLYLHYHVAGNDAVAKNFSRLIRSLESDRTVAAMQESAK